MTTVKGKSVRLYVEGLIILTFNDQERFLETGIHSQSHGHILEIRVYRKSASSDWERIELRRHEHGEIRYFETGRISIESNGDIINSEVKLATSYFDNDGEAWSPFNAIPNLEAEILGRPVTLDYNALKPAVKITAGDFYSVFNPLHLKDEQPDSAKDNLQSYVAEKDRVQHVRDNPHGRIDDLKHLEQRMGTRAENLGVRTYTAAAMLPLNKNQALIGQLEKEGAQPDIKGLFRVEYDPEYEIKIVVRNVPEDDRQADSEDQNQHSMGQDDPAHTFHFLHFYNAIKTRFASQNILGTELMMVKYANKDRIGIITGAQNPNCPMLYRIGPTRESETA